MPDDIREGEPGKRKPRRPREEDDDDDDFDRKSRKVARGDDDDGSNTPLSAVVPVGVSLWALASLYLALLGCVIPGLGLLAIVCGILAFVTQKHRASYGSVTGNMRAIIGIGIGVFATAIQCIALIGFLAGRP